MFTYRWHIPIAFIAMVLTIGVGVESASAQAGVQVQGGLGNFDVRYPGRDATGRLPNDIEIFLYGDGLKASDVTSTWNTNKKLGDPPVGLCWGTGEVEELGVNEDPNSPAFGLDCIVVRYKGEPRPELVGKMVHLGVRLRRCVSVLHQEVRWTFDRDPNVFERPCDPHITWICTRDHIVVCVANPTPNPFYIYGCRWFPVPLGVTPPPLSALNLGLDPGQIGQQWNRVVLPGGRRTFCLPPWCRIYLRIPVVRWRPIIFQLAARNVDVDVLPLENDGVAPDPNDFRDLQESQQGTMAILTARSIQTFPSDLNCDGSVDALDLRRVFGPAFGQVSDDFPQPPTTEAAQ